MKIKILKEGVIAPTKGSEHSAKIDTRTHTSQFGKPPFFKYYHFKWKPTDDEEIKNKQQKLYD